MEKIETSSSGYFD